ncbi:outer membrane beta-barrel protein [Filimonas effusa]|uniref:Uncharacterized protein n=1 Tax=Filimonas effusa TaxID=2508721 RepID=A0A4Q1D8B6_9BACT|nr:outer membrane beta-barrel protein [Filimonas effusa]RXK85440.1 hypothetical protein ESB13_01040 [Filimonas effusa]
MKKIIAFVLFVAAANSMNAQKMTVALNGGIAGPMGAFSRSDYYNEKSGFAKAGYHFNLSATYKLNKSLGINMLLGYSQFGHKGLRSLAEGYKEDSGTDSTTVYSRGTNHSFSVLIGPAYFLPVSKKLTLSARVLGGYVRTSLSGFQVFYEDYTDNAMTQKKASAGAFGGQAGLGLAYQLSNRVSIRANADQFLSSPAFKISYEHYIVNSGRRLSDYHQTLSGINATVGVGITLF